MRIQFLASAAMRRIAVAVWRWRPACSSSAQPSDTFVPVTHAMLDVPARETG